MELSVKIIQVRLDASMTAPVLLHIHRRQPCFKLQLCACIYLRFAVGVNIIVSVVVCIQPYTPSRKHWATRPASELLGMQARVW